MKLRSIALAFLVLALGGTALLLFRRPNPATGREVFTPIVWTVDPPEDRPTGDPFRVVRTPAPSPVRWKGEFGYEQQASGTFDKGHPIPSRRLVGTFTALETTAGADRPTTTVELALELDTSLEPSAPARKAVSARLTFERGADGKVGHRSIRLEAPKDVAGDLEVLGFAWTHTFAPPDRPVRVGQRLPIDECVDLEYPFQRPLLFLFQRRAISTGPVTAPVEGGVWIESREAGGDGGVRIRAALTHAYAGLNGSDEPDAVTIDYHAVLSADRTVGAADGAVRRHAMTLARRSRFTARDLDYTVVTLGRVAMAVDPAAR